MFNKNYFKTPIYIANSAKVNANSVTPFINIYLFGFLIAKIDITYKYLDPKSLTKPEEWL